MSKNRAINHTVYANKSDNGQVGNPKILKGSKQESQADTRVYNAG